MAINPADITTIRVGQLPPDLPTLESNIAHELGDILYRCTIQELVDLLSLNVGTLQYEVKTLYVNQEYIDNNFDETGLGINLCAGFAICNGANGTVSVDGLVDVGYGTNYNVIGGFGGEKEHQLTENEMPTHNHSLIHAAWSGSTPSKPYGVNFDGGSDFGVSTETNAKGLGDAHNNMQPYIVALKIMKL